MMLPWPQASTAPHVSRTTSSAYYVLAKLTFHPRFISSQSSLSISFPLRVIARVPRVKTRCSLTGPPDEAPVSAAGKDLCIRG